MNDTYTTPEGRIDDLAKDFYIAGITAKQGRLDTRFADRVATRLRAAASNMIEDHDASC
jgi:hypothetical protein